MNNEEKIILWASLNCELNNVKWLGTDPSNICSLNGSCPLCREDARKALMVPTVDYKPTHSSVSVYPVLETKIGRR